MRVRTVVTVVLLGLLVAGAAWSATTRPKNLLVSHCVAPNAEVEQAVDGKYVYEDWMGCGRGIGFARSTNGGKTFGPTKAMAGSKTTQPGRDHSWDPAITVGPNGTVYVAYMQKNLVGSVDETSPVVAVSHDHGKSFTITNLPVPTPDTTDGNWGDRDFIAVAPDGTAYVTWDYGPSYDDVTFNCIKDASCDFAGGDFNAVLQKSTDGGKTWTMPSPVSPGFPLGGVYSAPIVVAPNGTLDVLYWQNATDQSSMAILGPGRELFTRSTDGGATWSTPVQVGADAGPISLDTWWIDGTLAVDHAGNLYATWDTQGSTDTAWLAWSTDGGATWSTPLRVAASHAEHLTEVAPAGTKNVYVGWQTTVGSKGYATFLRRYVVGKGWTSAARQVSRQYGDSTQWPGDTFGLSSRGGTAVLSWGSATTGPAQIYAAKTTLPAHH